MKRGVALITITATILVLAILTISVSIGSSTLISRSKKLKFANEILQVQKLTKDYEIRKSGVLDFDIYTFDIDIIADNVKKSYFEAEADGEGIVLLYIVDPQKIDVSELNRGNITTSVADRYLYSATTKKVYYEAGYTVGDTTYYGINEELESMLR